MSATDATCCHQAAASPAVYGALLTSRNGLAPRAASVLRYVSTFSRYCAFVVDHGVSSPAPASSFSAIHGVEHEDCCAAYSKSRFARALAVSRSNGTVGVPTRSLFRYMSQ